MEGVRSLRPNSGPHLSQPRFYSLVVDQKRILKPSVPLEEIPRTPYLFPS
jgi:hypothetical protein